MQDVRVHLSILVGISPEPTFSVILLYEDYLLISFCSNNFEILYIILFVGVVGGGGEGGN